MNQAWFDQLVERGRPVEARQRQALSEWGERTGTTVREMKKLFEDTVEYESKSLLKRLGMMTRDDVRLLAARIDSLAMKVDELVASYEIAGTDTADTAEAAPAEAAPKSRRPRQRKS